MADLRKRFGSLVAAHRKRRALTQEALATEAGISVEMVSKIESGRTGTSFVVIERLSEALKIDPAELFTTELKSSASGGPVADIAAELSLLPKQDLVWIKSLIDLVLNRPRP